MRTPEALIAYADLRTEFERAKKALRADPQNKVLREVAARLSVQYITTAHAMGFTRTKAHMPPKPEPRSTPASRAEALKKKRLADARTKQMVEARRLQNMTPDKREAAALRALRKAVAARMQKQLAKRPKG